MLNFGLSLLISVGVYLVVFGLVVLLKRLLKKIPFKAALSIDSLINFGFYLLLTIIYLLIIHLSFSVVRFLPILLLSIFTSLVVVFIPLWGLIKKIKSKEFKTIDIFKVIGFMGSIVILTLEVGLFSNVGNNKSEAINIPFNSAYITQTSGEMKGDYIEYNKQRGFICFDNRELRMDSIYLDLSSSVETRLQVDVMTSNDDASYNFRIAYTFDPKAELFEYFDISMFKDEGFIKIVFVIDETNLHTSNEISPIRLNSIIANRPFPYVFNPIRCSLLIGVFIGVLFIFKKGNTIKLKEIEAVDLLKLIVLIACGVGFIYIIVNSLLYPSTHYMDVAKTDVATTNIYYQLFDAVKKGRLALDLEPSKELLALENPYDPAARSGVPYLWDHAYYKGHYYCYYGLAPVLLVMMPVYLLTGFKYTASVLLMGEIGTLFSIMAFCLLILQLTKVLFKKINLPVLICVLVASVFTSLLMSNTIFEVGIFYEGIYRVPYSYGLCFLFLVLYFLLLAYQNQRMRVLYLALVGLFVVLLVLSRPTLIIALVLTVPLFIKMLIEKYSIKKKLIDFAPMVGVVLIGAIFVMIYNYKRFDSILEFGQTYQFTVVDNTKLAYSTKGLMPAFYQFYLVSPNANSNNLFPFISYGYYQMQNSYHTYNAGSIGLLYFPLLWSLIALPFVFDKNDDLCVRIMLYMSPFVVYFLGFTTYCFAGICPRYVVEMTAISTVFAAITILKLFEKTYSKYPRISLCYLTVILLASSFISFNLLFGSFDGWLESDQHSLLEIVRTIFNNYNVNIYD